MHPPDAEVSSSCGDGNEPVSAATFARSHFWEHYFKFNESLRREKEEQKELHAKDPFHFSRRASETNARCGSFRDLDVQVQMRLSELGEAEDKNLELEQDSRRQDACRQLSTSSLWFETFHKDYSTSVFQARQSSERRHRLTESSLTSSHEEAVTTASACVLGRFASGGRRALQSANKQVVPGGHKRVPATSELWGINQAGSAVPWSEGKPKKASLEDGLHRPLLQRRHSLQHAGRTSTKDEAHGEQLVEGGGRRPSTREGGLPTARGSRPTTCWSLAGNLPRHTTSKGHDTGGLDTASLTNSPEGQNCVQQQQHSSQLRQLSLSSLQPSPGAALSASDAPAGSPKAAHDLSMVSHDCKAESEHGSQDEPMHCTGSNLSDGAPLARRRSICFADEHRHAVQSSQQHLSLESSSITPSAHPDAKYKSSGFLKDLLSSSGLCGSQHSSPHQHSPSSCVPYDPFSTKTCRRSLPSLPSSAWDSAPVPQKSRGAGLTLKRSVTFASERSMSSSTQLPIVSRASVAECEHTELRSTERSASQAASGRSFTSRGSDDRSLPSLSSLSPRPSITGTGAFDSVAGTASTNPFLEVQLTALVPHPPATPLGRRRRSSAFVSSRRLTRKSMEGRADDAEPLVLVQGATLYGRSGSSRSNPEKHFAP